MTALAQAFARYGLGYPSTASPVRRHVVQFGGFGDGCDVSDCACNAAAGIVPLPGDPCYTPDPATVGPIMDQGLAVLRAMLAQAGSQTATTVSAIGAQNVQNQVQANLVTDATYINQLDTTLRAQVLAGRSGGGSPYGLSDWLGFANTVASDISTQQGVSVDSSAWNTYVGAAGETAMQVVNIIKQIPQQVLNTLPKLGIGAGVIAAVAALGVAGYFLNAYSKVRRPTQGYRRRRRRSRR